MNTAQVRNRIIERLNSIEDGAFLRALDLLTKDKSNESVYILSDDQKARIIRSREQLASGQTISNEQMEQDIEKWLDSK